MVRHLQKISSAAPEYREAVIFLGTIRHQEKQVAERQQHTAEKEYAERIRMASQSEQNSRAQWSKNIQGLAHDSYHCGTSVAKTPIVSFDNHYWYADDGRRAAVVHEQQQEEESKRQSERKRRDDVAQLYCYWSTTLRVNTRHGFILAPERRADVSNIPRRQWKSGRNRLQCYGTTRASAPVDFTAKKPVNTPLMAMTME